MTAAGAPRAPLLARRSYESLRHCKWVDEIVVDSPWVISEAFLTEHDIDFVCHDDLPYTDTSGVSATGDVYEHIKRVRAV